MIALVLYYTELSKRNKKEEKPSSFVTDAFVPRKRPLQSWLPAWMKV